jgi:hypothetical protein
MKCSYVLITVSGHGRGLGQWLNSNLGDEYSVTSVLTFSVELYIIIRKFVVLSKKETPNNNGVGVEISQLKRTLMLTVCESMKLEEFCKFIHTEK